MKLSLDLVPSSAWYSNVRSLLSPSEWKRIRDIVAVRANHKCEICGGIGKQHSVECHEIWDYSEELIQKLVGLIALCPDCHQVKHFGLAQINNKEEIALKHLMKINKISKKVAEKYVADCFMEWAERSSKSWKLDISYLKEFDINVPVVQ